MSERASGDLEHTHITSHTRVVQGGILVALVSLITIPYIAVIHNSGMVSSGVYALAAIFTLGAVLVLNLASKRVFDRPAIQLGWSE